MPSQFVDLAQRRTEFLFHHITYGDMPLRRALANAWLQGGMDIVEATERRLEEPSLLANAGLRAIDC